MTCGSPSQALVTSAVLALASGCTAPLACDQEPASTPLLAGPLAGSLLLAHAGEAVSARFHARLEGLPELWPGESAIEWGSGVRLLVRLRYDELSFPAHVPTEMPRVAVRWSPASSSGLEDGSTPHLPPAEGSSFSNALFEACSSSGQTGCCDVGASSCSAPFEVTFERLDGEPYPVVRVEWQLSAGARVNTCPLGNAADLRLSLAEVP